jgi:predicted acyl esterase
MKMEPAAGALDYGIVVEKDVDVPMRDGAHLKADVFRPDAGGRFLPSSIWVLIRRTSCGFRRAISRKTRTR